MPMKPPPIGSTAQPFPTVRPRITVSPSRAKPFKLDCRSITGWGVGLDVGSTGWMSWYDPPNWRLTSVSFLHAARPAEVHGIAGVEIETLDWEPPGRRWRPGRTHFVRLTETTVEWLAQLFIRDGRRVLYTFLDEGFDRDWGESLRRPLAAGGLTVNKDGTFTLAVPPGNSSNLTLAAGMFRVGVGDKRVTCLRVIDLLAKTSSLRHRVALERETLAESFYTRQGQVILFRRYNGRLWRAQKKSPYGGRPWDERFPGHARLVINGAVFVHWYDCLTDVACGLSRRG